MHILVLMDFQILLFPAERFRNLVEIWKTHCCQTVEEYQSIWLKTFSSNWTSFFYIFHHGQEIGSCWKEDVPWYTSLCTASTQRA